MPLPILLVGFILTVVMIILLMFGVAVLLGWFVFNIQRLIFLAVGLYILLKQVLPRVAHIKRKEETLFLLLLTAIGILLVYLGIPNQVFMAIGKPMDFSVMLR